MSFETIDRLLTSLAVRAHAFAMCEIKSGHRLRFDPTEAVTIHYVLSGRGTIQATSGVDAPYGPCCVIVVPAHVEHSLGGSGARTEVATSTAACGLLADGLVRFTAGDGARDTLVVCATVTAIYGGALGVFDALSAPLVEDCAGKEFAAVFATLIDEVNAPSVGTRALVEALMKQALILFLRNHLTRLNVASPLFVAMNDERLARAVAAVIERPANGWAVDALASLAGMSRSAFAERFTRVFGRTPMAFVQVVRLRVSADLLRATDLSIAVIAASAGYHSHAYFNRAFKSAFGETPQRHRSRVRSAEAAAFGAIASTPPDTTPRPPARG